MAEGASRRRQVFAALTVTGLAGCAFTVSDPDEFRRRATHIDAVIEAPHRKLFDCLLEREPATRSQGGWTSDFADSGSVVMLRGAIEIRLSPITPSRTAAKISGLRTTNPFLFPERWELSLKSCEQK